MLFPRALADILRQQGPIPISQYDCENFAVMNGSPKDNTPARTSSKNHYTPVHTSKSNHGKSSFIKLSICLPLFLPQFVWAKNKKLAEIIIGLYGKVGLQCGKVGSDDLSVTLWHDLCSRKQTGEINWWLCLKTGTTVLSDWHWKRHRWK